MQKTTKYYFYIKKFIRQEKYQPKVFSYATYDFSHF